MSKSNAHEQAIERFRIASQEMSRPSTLMRALIAERAGLNTTDAECIDYLLSCKAATPSDLVAATGLSKSAMTTVIKRLEKAGYITRGPDPEDRRKTQITPNMPQIQNNFGPYYKAVTVGFREIVADYGMEELELLTKHSLRMTKLYEQQVERLNDPHYSGM